MTPSYSSGCIYAPEVYASEVEPRERKEYEKNMNRGPFETGSIYHLYNRGTEKRRIFLNDIDYHRFTDNLYEFNDSRPSLNWRQKELPEVRPREKIVEILAYCLLPNHYHLMVRQIHDSGITLFMRKLATGYTMYFNKKYDRSGALFQGKFKSVLVDRDEYLKYLPHYIHRNPAELSPMSWRDYRWSSYQSFLTPEEKSPFLDLDFMKTLYEPFEYKAALDEWVKDAKRLSEIRPILLD